MGVDIPAFINRIHEGDYVGAIMKLWEKNSLPAVCGRVCPQENQCEGVCIVGKKDKPVAIGSLERFAADWARSQKDIPMPPVAPKTGKKVAVVGSGPGGLTVAGDLIRKGHEVTVFEAFHKAGGVLVYGIPEFQAAQGDSGPRGQLPGETGSEGGMQRRGGQVHHRGRAFG